MYIKNRMTKNPYTIPSSTTIADAVALFREKGFKRQVLRNCRAK